MIKVENVEVFNFEGAIRGLRNPMNSWDKSDSVVCEGYDFYDCVTTIDACPRKDAGFKDDVFCIGKADLELMRKLYKAGSEHRKYLRQIFVSMDITAPLYWISEFDTYKIGTVRNSCSFMHKGVYNPFNIKDFSTHDDRVYGILSSLEKKNSENTDLFMLCYIWETIIDNLNRLRDIYLETKDNQIFQQIRCLLPSGYNQRFTVTMNYENVVTIIKQRAGHRLSEWEAFILILKELPYIKEIME